MNGTTSATIDVVITNDDIFESPDEHNVRLLAPGFQPTFGGQLWSTVTIQDDGDGASAQAYFHTFTSDELHVGLINLDIHSFDPSNQNLPPECTVHQIKRPRTGTKPQWVSNGQL